MPALSLRPLEVADVPALAALLAARRREERVALPLLNERFADVGACTEVLLAHLAAARCDGVVAERGGRLAGFLIGHRRHTSVESFEAQYEPPTQASMPGSGHGVSPGEDVEAVYAAMYAYLGERWVDGGYFEHRITMPLGMPASVEAWFHLGFGSLYTFCVRESTPLAAPRVDATTEVQRATPSERAEVLRFQDESGRWHRSAPIFWPYMERQASAAIEAFTAGALTDESNGIFLARRHGVAVALHLMVAQADWGSSFTQPDDSIYLYEGITSPEARGTGAGTAILAHTLDWAREAGHPYVTLHYATPNASGGPFWRAHGFVPVEVTLQRRLDERLAWARA
ncbi:MAG: GNAT family N-acetyltransferase [Dehalococcoidia bacterium]|nr:MAG: GNAT family N-acetyltransferase [Dehalococcoidia bacterium]